MSIMKIWGFENCKLRAQTKFKLASSFANISKVNNKISWHNLATRIEKDKLWHYPNWNSDLGSTTHL